MKPSAMNKHNALSFRIHPVLCGTLFAGGLPLAAEVPPAMNQRIKTSRFCLLLAGVLLLAAFTGLRAFADPLADSFRTPPDAARPGVLWFWINGNISSNGITADLEAMRRVGIGRVLIMEVTRSEPAGPVAFMNLQWRDLFKHTLAEARRLGLEVNPVGATFPNRDSAKVLSLPRLRASTYQLPW